MRRQAVRCLLTYPARMQTPHDKLYYFTSKELTDLKLATAVDAGKPRNARR